MSHLNDGLDDEQVRALREAAQLIKQARDKAAELLARSGIDPRVVAVGSLDFCTVVESKGPPARTCGCPGFRGDPDFCFSQYQDFTGPDIGAGAIIRICGHPRSAHEAF
ncbi:DUF6422 family protein [Streptomyces sp. NPDC090127]|uniref:DUF6422 family protein n=1 Tax=Streptomyces sp. NPDC090127 TaxID=3365953 RepID=UPI0038123983